MGSKQLSVNEKDGEFCCASFEITHAAVAWVWQKLFPKNSNFGKTCINFSLRNLRMKITCKVLGFTEMLSRHRICRI